jgi:hypothetical protein
MIEMLLEGPLVHRCDSQPHLIGSLKRDDPRDAIEETLDVVKIDGSTCTLQSNAPPGGWEGDTSSAPSTPGHGCAACAVLPPQHRGDPAVPLTGLVLVALWRIRRLWHTSTSRGRSRA